MSTIKAQMSKYLPLSVIPAEAGIHYCLLLSWIPAFAGMTTTCFIYSISTFVGGQPVMDNLFDICLPAARQGF